MSLSSEMKMEAKLIAMILGVTLVLATATIVTTHQAFAADSHGNNGATKGPCSSNENNPHCSSTPGGDNGGTNPGFGRGFGGWGW